MDNKKIPGLDHLRALAIMLVFLFHYRLFAHPAWVDDWCKFGWTGVDLFFVLSGYLIAGQIFKGIRDGNFSLQTFFIKRFFRILPAYWTVLALYFLIPAFREWESLPPLWKFLTFTQNIGLDRRTGRTFSHAWSLCIEEQFYLLFPLTVLTLYYFKASKKAAWMVAGLFLAGFAIRTASWNTFIVPVADTENFGNEWFKWIYYPTWNRLDGLLAGISIAGIVHFFEKGKQFIERYSNYLLLSGLALAACAYHLCYDMFTFPASIFGYPLIAIAYGLIVSNAAANNGLLNRFSSRVTSYIAMLSYSIYLVHKATIHLAQEWFSKAGVDAESTVMFFLSIIVSVAGAALLHYCIEKPFLRLKDKILARRKITTPMPVSIK